MCKPSPVGKVELGGGGEVRLEYNIYVHRDLYMVGVC